MRHLKIFFWAFCCLLISLPARGAELGPELADRLRQASPSDSIPVIVQLRERLDLSQFQRGRSGARDLIQSLQETSHRAQGRLRSFVEERGLSGSARFLWIIDAVVLKCPPGGIQEMLAFSEVERIDLDRQIRLPETIEEAGESRTTPWNIHMIGADSVWAKHGLDGTGVVVGQLDTGVDITHPALAWKWRGGWNSWRDFINGEQFPYDDYGHGTHVMGTILGGDGPGPFDMDIGIAYGARFIAAKIYSSSGYGPESAHLEAAQWMLDPDGDPNTDDLPDVINNSWGWDWSPTGFYESAAAWRAAGIVPVFAIGNRGPNPGTTNPPGNYNNVVGVGGTDSNDGMYNGSSRGPSPAGWAYPLDRQKPDLSAPGQSVLSSVPGGWYQTYTGTSMATPHVTGVVALLLQKDPSLTYECIKGILETTAVDCGSPGYDYDFGYGRLDALAAVEAELQITGACCTPANGCVQVTCREGCPAPSVFLGWGSVCDPEPCTAPPGACCSSGACTLTFASTCPAPGVWQGDWTSCSPNPCPPAGACCDPLTGGCTYTLEPDCSSPNFWHGGGSVCVPNPCPQIGVCCDPITGECTQTLEVDCPTPDLWHADLTTCAPNPCQLGVCCDLTGGCTVAIRSACPPPNTWFDLWTSCLPNPCPLVGACCHPNLTCEILPESSCQDQWIGAGVPCMPTPCGSRGACCWEADGSCFVMTSYQCMSSGGDLYLGDGTDCDPNPCPTSGIAQALAEGNDRVLAVPNPSLGPCTLWYRQPEAGDARLEIFDAAGKRIWSSEVRKGEVGVHSMDWDGRSIRGEELRAGVYFARLRAGGRSWGRTIIRIR